MNDLLHAFPGQEVNEPVYVFARPYPLSFLPTALIFVIIFLFTLLAQYLLSTGGLVPLTADQANQGIIFIGVFQLFALVVFLVTVLDFYFDIIIVTDRRLVDIDQEVLFFRRISELSLGEVEDVTSLINGFLQTAFNYGQVEVQTAAAEEKFIMNNVRYPREITAIVLDLAEQAKHEVPVEQRVPESEFVAVIDNKTISTVAELQQIGGILPSDLRRVPRNAP